MKSKHWPIGIEIGVQLCLWFLIFSFPLLFWANDHTITLFDFLRFFSTPFCLAIVFYLNYFVLIKKYLLKEKLALFITLNLILICVLLLGIALWHELLSTMLNENRPIHAHKGPSPFFFLIRSGSLLVLTCGLSVAIRTTANWYKSQLERQSFEKEKAELVLRNLKNQLHPHFLFNTLNNIYALIKIDPDKAQYSVQNLSKLLRYVLKESELDSIRLSEEITFMLNYISLMSLRLGENVSVSVDFPSEQTLKEKNYPFIAPLLFINLIENAFKYGSLSSEDVFILISLKIKKDNTLEFTCSNTVSKSRLCSENDTGIGIPNLKKRLDYLYPEKYLFETKKENGSFFAYLRINL